MEFITLTKGLAYQKESEVANLFILGFYGDAGPLQPMMEGSINKT